MPEVVVLPGLLSGLAAPDCLLIDQHFDCTQVASEIAGVRV